MIGGALKLGLAAGVGYVVGGSVGIGTLELVSKQPSAEARTGAAWAGRIATTLILVALLSRSSL